MGKHQAQLMLACMPVQETLQRSTCPDKRLRPELMYDTGAVTVLQTALPHEDVCKKHIAFCVGPALTNAMLQCMTQQDTQSCTVLTACSMSPTASEAATTTSPACIANMYDGTLCYSLQSSSAIALSCRQDLNAITWAEVCL